jgi:hypothetical protein
MLRNSYGFHAIVNGFLSVSVHVLLQPRRSLCSGPLELSAKDKQTEEEDEQEMVDALKSKAKKAKKGIVESVQYAFGHKTRVQVLIVLNEGGIHTAQEISEEIDVPLNNLLNHLRRMLADGSIEIAEEKRKGNTMQAWYRAVEAPIYTVEDFEKLSPVHRQHIVGALVQAGTAEVLAGLYAGTLADPRATVYFDWYNLDAQGRQKADAITERYVEEMHENECDSINRVAKTREETTSMLLNVSFFERARKAARRAQSRLVTE